MKKRAKKVANRKKVQQKRRRCPNCKRMCANAGAMQTHWKAQHYVPPPPPPPPPEKKFVSYADLARSGWGKELTEYLRKHPAMEDLQVGYLALISEKLGDILKELRKERTIS